MELLDSRRLTGPNVMFDEPGTILDVACGPGEVEQLVHLWQSKVAEFQEVLDWPAAKFSHRLLSGGVSLAFAAPIDALYAATEVNEQAYAAAAAESGAGPATDFEASIVAIRKIQDEESNRPLLALANAARKRGTNLRWDDDEVSLGLGRFSTTWPARNIPSVGTLDWSSYKNVPVGIVTGTNGKTTTVRLVKHILQQAGHSVGWSSTDWIAVNDHILERGDWSGPGGARAVLRCTDADVAILESARGGLLRRGLGVQHADAALITNIAEDHFGDFGSRNLDELLEIKWVVSRAVRDTGVLILNADDERLVTRAEEYRGAIVWFSLVGDNPQVLAHVAQGGTAYVLDGHDIRRLGSKGMASICADKEIPISLGGLAKHNLANALAAAALSAELGASIADIRRGLTSMSQESNPGRCNVYTLGKRKVLVDFAHNPHAMRALLGMAEALPARRRALCFGQAGDRPDGLIRDMTRDAWAIGLDRVFVSELAAYHRGRQRGEVFAVIRDELLKHGAAESQVEHHELEVESLDAALRWAGDGDLVIMLALSASAEIREHLQQLADQKLIQETE
jgi:UDP-N-acetylmuramyl tripeptide synthase